MSATVSTPTPFPAGRIAVTVGLVATAVVLPTPWSFLVPLASFANGYKAGVELVCWWWDRKAVLR